VSQGRLTYRFGPLERRGLIGPVRTGQAAAVGLGALAAVALLDQLPSTSGAALAIVVFGGAVALASAPVAGRTLDEWAPLAASFALRRIAGRAHFRSPISTRGESSGAARSSQPVVPPALRGARIVEVAYRDRPLGAVSERGGRWLTAVLACRVEAFSLLDADAQERRLARWGLVLSTAASTPIRRIQWVERTAPAQGDELARWLHAERDPAVPLRGTPMIESYLELIGSTARVTQQHEVLLAIQLDARRVRERGADAGLRALIDETERVAQGLEADGVRSIRARPAHGARDGRSWPRRPRRAQRLAAGCGGGLGALPQRWGAPHDVLDRRLAAHRRLADVHGRLAGSLEHGPHSCGHVRAGAAGTLHARGRGGHHT
jgi:hypothetical protein